MINVLDTHKELIENYKGALGIHIAGFQRSFLNNSNSDDLMILLRITNTMAYPLGLKMIEKCISSELSSNKKVKLDFTSKKMEVNKLLLEGMTNLEDFLVIAKSAVANVFMEHIKSLATSDDNNKAFAKGMDWLECLRPVDFKENPKQYFEQKYIQDTISFTEEIMMYAQKLANDYIDGLGEV